MESCLFQYPCIKSCIENIQYTAFKLGLIFKYHLIKLPLFTCSLHASACLFAIMYVQVLLYESTADILLLEIPEDIGYICKLQKTGHGFYSV